MTIGSMRVVRLTGNQLRVVCENRALTGRLRAERDAVLRMSDQLRVASESKTRFFRGVSHELRTPLTVILGYAELQLRQPRERQTPDALEQMRDAGRFLERIVDDLLLVDRRLPDMDGLDAIRAERARECENGWSRRPIVVATASVMNARVWCARRRSSCHGSFCGRARRR